MTGRAVFLRTVMASALLTSTVFRASPAHGDESIGPLPTVVGGHYDYPRSARRLDQQGRFLVDLSIGPDGRVTDVGLVAADPAGIFDRSLAVNLRRLRFNVPSNWGPTGRSKLRFRVNFIFLVRPCRAAGPCKPLPPLSSDPIITFTAEPLGTSEPR